MLRHVEEEAFKYPVKPIEALATDYPGVNPAVFGATLSKPEVAALGVVVKDAWPVWPLKRAPSSC